MQNTTLAVPPASMSASRLVSVRVLARAGVLAALAVSLLAVIAGLG